MIITHDALDLTVHGPPDPDPIGHKTSLYSDPPWPPIDTGPHCTETTALAPGPSGQETTLYTASDIWVLRYRSELTDSPE